MTGATVYAAGGVVWRVVDGKLYLNYSKGVQKKWEQDRAGYIQKADQNWPGLHK